MHPYLNVAIKAAREAGKLMLKSLDRLDEITVTEKAKNDFVSEVDKHAENIIIQIIREAYPQHGFLAEESGQHEGHSDAMWIIDPLDGTANFIHGVPHFCISIAYSFRGKVEHGLIYDPIRQEFFTASIGEGARLNNRRIRVSDRSELDGAFLSTGFPFREREKMQVYFRSFQAFFQQASGIRRAGSAALDLAYLAAGRFDGFWEMGLKPWDIAAGVLLIQEAGGFVSTFSEKEDYLFADTLVAASPKLHPKMLAVIREHMKTE